ncbi:MAG: hypothetical protein JWP10_1877 [Nocardioidaceae bacterium]|nr:hypothetical protein [Nocardioidaceae bacterium]
MSLSPEVTAEWAVKSALPALLAGLHANAQRTSLPARACNLATWQFLTSSSGSKSSKRP